MDGNGVVVQLLDKGCLLGSYGPVKKEGEKHITPVQPYKADLGVAR